MLPYSDSGSLMRIKVLALFCGNSAGLDAGDSWSVFSGILLPPFDGGNIELV